MSSEDEIVPIPVAPEASSAAASAGGPGHAGGAAVAAVDEEEAVPAAAGVASAGSAVAGGTSQACSICGYRRRFKNDGHNASNCSAVSRECLSSPTVPLAFRTESCSCSVKKKKENGCVAKSVCVNCLQTGHNPTTLSLTKAFNLSRTSTGKVSVRSKKGNTYAVAFMVCDQTRPEHLQRAAAAAKLQATQEADEDQQKVADRESALQAGIVNLPPAGRAAAMQRATQALSGPAARAAVVVNPLGAAYNNAYAVGLAANLSNRSAMLYAGASAGGVEFGAFGSSTSENEKVVAEGMRKRLAAGALDRRSQKVARISGLLGKEVGASGSTRVRAHVERLNNPAPAERAVEPQTEPRGSSLVPGFGQLGPAGLAENLAAYMFRTNEVEERPGFVAKWTAGMAAHYLRGLSVAGTTMSVDSIVGIVLCKWGDEGQEHPPIEDIPVGLRDAVTTWVMSCRR